ncbi:MAG: SDR family NAD(P)-dependent oxidoreductase [Sphaerospermopsis sp. SIO1G2]|nr:SDR family NAD(P)-dependent oxidoreductase [Sphaerospermopsis sp. SIO1G2]
MPKTILITGSTDGIGLDTAKIFAEMGHYVLLHGRNPEKLQNVANELAAISAVAGVDSYVADLSNLADVAQFAHAVAQKHSKLDVLINNAGIYSSANLLTPDGLDARFAVNTIAPYLLAKALLPLMENDGRIVNLSSAAQAPVNLNALASPPQIADEFNAYAQSKLALTMWSSAMAKSLKNGPIMVSVNPGSMLGTKMVQQAFNVAGKDIGVGSKILVRASLSDEFAGASGQYFDNDAGRFAPPHPDSLNEQKAAEIVQIIEKTIAQFLAPIW